MINPITITFYGTSYCGNIRFRIKNAISALKEDQISVNLRVNKSLQELDALDEESNIPSFTRTQIWHVVSSLESLA